MKNNFRIKKYWMEFTFLGMVFLALSFLIMTEGVWTYIDAVFLLKNKAYFLGYIEHAQLFERGTSSFGYDSSFFVARLLSVEIADGLRFIFGYDGGVVVLYLIFFGVNFWSMTKILNYFFSKKVSFLGGMFFAFNPIALFFLNKTGFLFAYSSLPIIILSFIKYFFDKSAYKWIWIFNSVIGFYFIVSYPRITGIYGIFFLILGILFLKDIVSIFKDKKKELLYYFIFHAVLFAPVFFPVLFYYLSETNYSTNVSNYTEMSQQFSDNLYNSILKDNFFESYFLTEISDNFALLFQRGIIFKIISLVLMLSLISWALLILSNKVNKIYLMKKRDVLGLAMLGIIFLSITVVSLPRFVDADIFKKITYSLFPFIAGNTKWIYLALAVSSSYLISWVAFSQRKFFKLISVVVLVYCIISIWPLLNYANNPKLKTISFESIPEIYKKNFYDKNSNRTRPAMFFPSDQVNNNLIFSWSPYPVDVTFGDPYKPVFSNNSRISSSSQSLFYNELRKMNNSIYNAYVFNLEDVFIFKDVKNDEVGYDFFPQKNYVQLSRDYYGRMKGEREYSLKEEDEHLAHFVLNNFSQADFFIYSPKAVLDISPEYFLKQDKIDIKRRMALVDTKNSKQLINLKSKTVNQDVRLSAKYSAGNTTKYLIKLDNLKKNEPFLIQFNQTFGSSWKIKWVNREYFEKKKCLKSWENFPLSNNSLCLSQWSLLDWEDLKLLSAKEVSRNNHFQGNFFGNGWLVSSDDIPENLRNEKELYAVVIYEKQIYFIVCLSLASLFGVGLLILAIREMINKRF